MKRLSLSALAAAVAALSVAAASASAETPTAAVPRADSPTAGTVDVRLNVEKFVKKGNGIVATGAAIATFQPPTGEPTVVRHPFTAKVILSPKLRMVARRARICQVLYLQLDKLSLTLLGLKVNLDKVILTIKGDSNGGALGSLFCSLANAKVKLRGLSTTARRLTRAAAQSGLSTGGVGFGVPLRQGTAVAGLTTCSVLDLVLGPLDLKLLGLLVNLNQVHLTIDADPTGGALGALFCSLAKATPTIP
ncbi:MAG: hypothetical protein QOE36_2860 [Gaiellaceae bacterium]|jgi:hypothetical protein|nr:hypothetical protein [Gaiellaceae bacterium]